MREQCHIYFVSQTPAQTLSKARRGERVVTVKGHQEIQIRVGAVITAGGRAVQGCQPHAGLGTQRASQLRQQVPMGVEVLHFLFAHLDPSRTGTMSMDRAFADGAPQCALIGAKILG